MVANGASYAEVAEAFGWGRQGAANVVRMLAADEVDARTDQPD